MNLNAAARYLGSHLVVVRGLVSAGLIKLRKNGSHNRLVSKSTLDRIIAASDRAQVEFE